MNWKNLKPLVTLAAQAFENSDLYSRARVATAFEYVTEIARHRDELPPSLGIHFDEVWAAYSLPRPRALALKVNESRFRTYSDEEWIRCEEVTRAFARRFEAELGDTPRADRPGRALPEGRLQSETANSRS